MEENKLPPAHTWAKRITNVKAVSSEALRGATAAVNVETGVMYINKSIWPLLSPDAQCFIICHELAHLKYATDNEYLADEKGFEMYVKTGRSLREAVKSLCRDHSGHGYSEEIISRGNELFKKAIAYDQKQQHGTKYK